ncbi:MAG: hypothetical protein K9N51_04690 [Candidatus Pacebacteria bacterium]|nr:hypothetical protein [Candidatus Paceibacterota bacterium]
MNTRTQKHAFIPSNLSRHRIRYFNMIEVTLALGVIAIGVVSILALFPVGANASRDAMASTYATGAADELLHMLENNIRAPGGWTTYVWDSAAGNDDNSVLLENRPSDGAVDWDNFNIETSGDALNERETLYQFGTAGTTQTRRFKIIQYSDQDGGTAGKYDPGTDILDFEGIMVIWRSQVVINSTSMPYEYATALDAEISWPAAAPYTEREKKLFHLELFKR